MNIAELFFNAAIINLAVFFFLYCAFYNMQVISQRNFNNPILIITSLVFAPIFFIVFLLRKKIAIKNYLYSFFTSFIYCFLFYLFFIQKEYLKNNIENLFSILAVFNVVLGVILGFILSVFCKKIPFLQSIFMVFLLALASLSLSSFAEETFSFGTSSVYFITVLCWLDSSVGRAKD